MNNKNYKSYRTFILDSIKNKKNIDDKLLINLLQVELHEILYSYVNGGFSNKGYLLYPLVKDISDNIKRKIYDLKNVISYLENRSYDFENSLSLFKKFNINGKIGSLFISNLYKDFSNIKKNGIKINIIKSKKIDFKSYNKNDSEYLEPVKDMKKFSENKLKEYLLDFHVHGSLATRDYIKGWSDFDTLIIIKNETIFDPKKLERLRDLLYKSKKYFYKIDPLHHHGHLVITELDMEYYCQTFFPLILFNYSKSFLGNKILNFKIRDSKTENIETFYSFIEYFRDIYLNNKFNMGSYELKYFFHAVTLFPTLYLQAKGNHMYKKFTFEKSKKDFDKKLWKPIETVSKIRKNWEVPNNLPIVDLISIVNPLLAYQINSKYWDMFSMVNSLNDINLKELVKGMYFLSEKAWVQIKK